MSANTAITTQILKQLEKKLKIKIDSERVSFDTAGEVTFLDLSKCGVQSGDLELIGSLTNLTNLRLDNNQITEIKGLDKLSRLEYLWLGYNQITEIKGLEGLKSLTELWSHNNQITEIKGLDGLSNLIYLGLGYNQIREIKGLEGLKSLTTLSLSGNQIKNTDFKKGSLKIYLYSQTISNPNLKIHKK